jgi:hypothetical protein
MMRLTATIVSVLLLAGCAGQVVDTSCTAFQPITYSAAGDTEPTKSQIRGHNAAWQRLCK